MFIIPAGSAFLTLPAALVLLANAQSFNLEDQAYRSGQIEDRVVLLNDRDHPVVIWPFQGEVELMGFTEPCADPIPQVPGLTFKVDGRTYFRKEIDRPDGKVVGLLVLNGQYHPLFAVFPKESSHD